MRERTLEAIERLSHTASAVPHDVLAILMSGAIVAMTYESRPEAQEQYMRAIKHAKAVLAP